MEVKSDHKTSGLFEFKLQPATLRLSHGYFETSRVASTQAKVSSLLVPEN